MRGGSGLLQQSGNATPNFDRFGAATGRLLEQYMNTTEVAPVDKDSRDLPAFGSTLDVLELRGWTRTILTRRARESVQCETDLMQTHTVYK